MNSNNAEMTEEELHYRNRAVEMWEAAEREEAYYRPISQDVPARVESKLLFASREEIGDFKFEIVTGLASNVGDGDSNRAYDREGFDEGVENEAYEQQWELDAAAGLIPAEDIGQAREQEAKELAYRRLFEGGVDYLDRNYGGYSSEYLANEAASLR